MKKLVLLSCLFTFTASVNADGFSELSTGGKIVSSIVFIILVIIITSPVWGLIWYFVRKRKKAKEHEEWRKAYYAKQLEEKRKIESKGLERLKKVEELTEQKSKILEVSLAGLYYRPQKVHEIAGALNVGDHLELKRNPGNEYDEFAVKVIASGTHIGFIPQTDSEEVSNEIKRGKGYRAFVSRTDKENIPHIDIKLFPYEQNQYKYLLE